MAQRSGDAASGQAATHRSPSDAGRSRKIKALAARGAGGTLRKPCDIPATLRPVIHLLESK
jgi:hypothetical protein